MAEPSKHSCKIFVCPDCGARYSAQKMELLVFNPFHGKQHGGQGGARTQEKE